MTTIQRLPLLTMLGTALILPAGFPGGTSHGRYGDATPRGLWRSAAAGPAAGLVQAVTGRPIAAGPARGDLRHAIRPGGPLAARASRTRARGRGP
ncbi:MAG TPA: hypothetical protein VIX86_10865 [Streptosporangiaceae bacterium]